MGLPDIQAEKAVAAVCKAIKHPKLQQRGDDILARSEENWKVWTSEWIEYAKKHWVKTYGIEFDEWY